MKQHKLWKTEEGGLCCSSSDIQTRLGPLSLREEQSKIPIVFVVSFLLLATTHPPPPPLKLGESARAYGI